MEELWKKIRIFLDLETVQPDCRMEEVERIDQAKREWLQAQLYFQHIHDPDLIEYAIYAIKAAELRYNYLLKQARFHRLCVYPLTGRIVPVEESRISGDLSS